MIPVPENMLLKIKAGLGIGGELTYIGGGREDSDGIVYSYNAGDEKFVLKILSHKRAADEPEVVADTGFDRRMKFASYLGENGIRIAHPLRLDGGGLYLTLNDDKNRYTAYIMRFFKGAIPGEGPFPDNFVKNWGKMTGRAHALTKSFEYSSNVPAETVLGEAYEFREMCGEPAVKAAWTEMIAYLASLPVTPDTVGFIHNDNHSHNILADGDELTLIDFDCASVQFFIQDVMTPCQALLFNKAGGMVSPVVNPDMLKRFYAAFIDGYETENHLGGEWYSRLTEFVSYRRMLLFTVMEGWINTQPELKKGFLANIANPPVISI